MRTRLRACVFGLAMALGGSAAWGQIVPEGALKLQSQFNFSNPGARSLALAGAFVARADDATAAYANPAGLIHLRSPELTVEGRRWDTEATIRDATGQPTSLGGSQTGASFFALSYPVKRFTLAIYRHELANLELGGRTSEFSAAELDLEITGIGLAAGYEIGPRFRVGVAVVAYQSDLAGVATTVGGETSRVAGDGDELGFTLGYQVDLTEDWSMGFVLREGPTFDVTYDPESDSGQDQFAVPDLVGAGLAWQATHRLAASLDYYFVQYSATVDNRRRGEGRFVVPDAHELRLGLEYTFWEYTSSPALRFGVWRDPDHQIRFKPRDGSLQSRRGVAEFPRGEDQIHLSLGFGVVLGPLQLDVGADFSDRIDIYSLSFVWFL